MKQLTTKKKVLRVIFILILSIGLIVGIFVLRAVIVVGPQIDAHKAYWEQRANEQTDAPRRYIALGDSAAQSVGASSPEKGYVGLIAREIAEKTNQPVHVVNISKSGAKLKAVIEEQIPRLRELSVTEKDIVAIEIGANDMGSYEESRFYEEMQVIMAALPEQTVIATMPYFGGGRKRADDSNAFKASAQIRELAAKSNLRVAELYGITKQNDSWRNYAADFFHPSNRAYKFWAESFLVHIRNDI